MTETDKTRQKLVESMRMSKSAGSSGGASSASGAAAQSGAVKKAPAKKKAPARSSTRKTARGQKATPSGDDRYQSPGRIWPD